MSGARDGKASERWLEELARSLETRAAESARTLSTRDRERLETLRASDPERAREIEEGEIALIYLYVWPSDPRD